MSECRFVVGSLGSGGISEAASLGDPSYSLQRRRAKDSPLPPLRDADAAWGDESRVAGVEERDELYGFMHNVETWGVEVAQAGLRGSYLVRWVYWEPLINPFNTISWL